MEGEETSVWSLFGGIKIKFPVEDYAYRIAFAAKVYDEALEKYGFDIYEERKGPKKGMKTLIKKL